MNAANAADYPALAPDVFVIWRGTRVIWPHPERKTLYLSATKTQLDGSARYTDDSSDAKTFESYLAASDWMAENRKIRGQAYDGAEICTVAKLIDRRFPDTAAAR